MSKVDAEKVKAESNGLRGTIAEELAQDTAQFSEENRILIKFHGTYQQDDRDRRKALQAEGKEPAYSFMIRTTVPGGVLAAEQYLELDRLADAYGNGTLRVTTRQGFQLHGVLKRDLKATIREMNEALVSTLSACGDVVRNVTGCSAPQHAALHRHMHEATRRIAERLRPRTGAYHEIWLDGEKVQSTEDESEPVYGKTYLPRKFKIGLAFPHDNCVDVHTQDIGLILLPGPGGALEGFNVLVGGGLGRSAGKEDTFPRLADPLAFVTPDEMLDVVEGIVKVQRDHGNRKERKHARLKYLVHAWGVERFREELEKVVGRKLAPPRPLPPLGIDHHLGWHVQEDGRLWLGVLVENGRIRDAPPLRLRTALRAIVSAFRPEVRLTPTHNVILAGIDPEDRLAVDDLLRRHGYAPPEEVSNARRFAMACPALPTCSLAVAESERALPGVIDELEALLAELGLADEAVSIRMTGCPNGCARPYVAEVGFVGRAPNKYALYLGGAFNGTRLAQVFADIVDRKDIAATLRPILARFKQERNPGESLGDWCARVGVDKLAGPA